MSPNRLGKQSFCSWGRREMRFPVVFVKYNLHHHDVSEAGVPSGLSEGQRHGHDGEPPAFLLTPASQAIT